MATRANKPGDGAAPKKPRGASKAAASRGSELSAALPTAEAADSGGPTNGLVAPGSTIVDDSRIAQRAYELYEESGWRSGNELEHWFRAEEELRGPGRG